MPFPMPIVLGIDVEPDGADFDPSAEVSWEGFERSLLWLPALREALARRSARPARFLWMVRCDPQLAHTYGEADWALRRYREALTALHEAGDEIGLHVHMYRWDGGARRWVTDFADSTWVRHCLDTGIDGFERCFDRVPGSVSIGYNWLSTDLVNRARERGVSHDLSTIAGLGPRPYPARNGRVRGEAPDFGSVPPHPYAPHRRDFLTPAPTPDGFWIVPLTSSTHCHPGPKGTSGRLHIRLGRRELAPVVAERRRESRPAHLVVALRSSAFGSEPYRAGIADSLAFLAELPGAAFVRAAELVETVARADSPDAPCPIPASF